MQKWKLALFYILWNFETLLLFFTVYYEGHAIFFCVAVFSCIVEYLDKYMLRGYPRHYLNDFWLEWAKKAAAVKCEEEQS